MEFPRQIASEQRTVTPRNGLGEVKEEPEEFYSSNKDQKRATIRQIRSRGSALKKTNDSDSELTEILEET